MHQRIIGLITALLIGSVLTAPVAAAEEGKAAEERKAPEERKIDIYQLTQNEKNKGIGSKIGTITFEDSPKGLVIKPNLKGLPPGEHGFHVHQMPACEGEVLNGLWVAGSTAGPHLDPQHTEHHLGPKGEGHLGDLPALVVDKDGNAKEPSLAPRLTVVDITHHSVIIHANGDNYSDEPKPLGGGGERIACGRIH